MQLREWLAVQAGSKLVSESQRERGGGAREGLFSVITDTEPSGFEDLGLSNGAEIASVFDLDWP